MTPAIAPAQTLAFAAAAEAAARAIPPAFPLDAAVAVNPFLGQSDLPLPHAAALLARTTGARLTLPRDQMMARAAAGEITRADLTSALDSLRANPDLAALLPTDAAQAWHILQTAPAPAAPRPLATLADLAAEITGTDWPGLVAERIGHWAAGHFDQGQALWPAPPLGAWASWRSHAQHDLTPEIAGLKGFAAHVAGQPVTAREALSGASHALGLDPASAQSVYHRLLADMGGWAQLARGLGWPAERAGESDSGTTDLLTIRLVWESALLAHLRERIAPAWADLRAAHAAPPLPDADLALDLALHEAANRAAERRLAERLSIETAAPAAATAKAPQVQAVFCIDVRSEPFRRALEGADPGIATFGFAGFFGLPLSHKALASDLTEARAPVLLEPALHSHAGETATQDGALRLDRRASRAWGRFRIAAVSSFAFVESAGLLYAAKLIRDSLGRGHDRTASPAAPRLDLPLSEKVAMAKGALVGMGLAGRLAPLVVFVGHGSHVVNAPQASLMQCGACGGHAGDVNAALLAGLLNEAEVRKGLAAEGVEIPQGTHFIGALHDTVSDEVRLIAPDAAPDGTAVARLKKALAAATAVTRTERALRLPQTAAATPADRRGQDWAQLRPEWALAGCNAFIAAPREMTRGRSLGGQAFLHSYDWRADPEWKVLTTILTAPVVVASWIALQYHGATTAPALFGAGNKLIHNVTGGIGVVEGNGGTLRAGPAWQSVHDGAKAMHDPLRLTVAVAAPPEAIGQVLDAAPQVRALFDNGWLALFALDDTGRMAWRYSAGGWQETAETGRVAA
ncbi:MAG: DUF2309 family protein [Limimaricola sp.]|nr:DUF2309 family protein [Limimaricola sp.]